MLRMVPLSQRERILMSRVTFPMAARLKTYAAEIDGLHEWIVAAPNQAAALEAFGVGQNLFAQGAARVETDPEKVKCALVHPGVPLRRLKGSSDPFGPVAANAPSGWEAALEAAAKAPRSEKTGTKAAKAAKAKPLPPSRRALDKAEEALAEVESDRDQALTEIEEERRALAEREAGLKARFKTRLARAKDRVKEEAAAYRRAGGQ
jgi:hypothetical protein